MKCTLLFPGQGSQSVGMGKDLFDAHESARLKFQKADSILGRDLSRIIFEGPQEELTATQNTQPALFTVEAVISDLLLEKGIEPQYVAGHSLGEYSALYAAGVLSFEDGLSLVAKRGTLMAQAGKDAPGTMAAVMGLSKDKIKEVLAQVKSGIVVSANENTPEQTVISGEVAAVSEAAELLKAAGAKRSIPLPVSGAFHSPLMKGAAEQFASVLEPVNFSAPRCPVITNVTAQAETDPSLLKKLLVEQLVNPVRWVDSMATLGSLNPALCAEVGPGSVLRGMVKKCAPELNVVPCDTAENIYSLLNLS